MENKEFISTKILIVLREFFLGTDKPFRDSLVSFDYFGKTKKGDSIILDIKRLEFNYFLFFKKSIRRMCT